MAATSSDFGGATTDLAELAMLSFRVGPEILARFFPSEDRFAEGGWGDGEAGVWPPASLVKLAPVGPVLDGVT